MRLKLINTGTAGTPSYALQNQKGETLRVHPVLGDDLARPPVTRLGETLAQEAMFLPALLIDAGCVAAQFIHIVPLIAFMDGAAIVATCLGIKRPLAEWRADRQSYQHRADAAAAYAIDSGEKWQSAFPE